MNNKTPLSKVTRALKGGFKVASFLFALMMVLPNVVLAPVEVVQYAAAEAPEVRIDVDMEFFRAGKADWKHDFANASSGMNLTFDDTSGTWQTGGYMYSEAAATETDYANVVPDHIDSSAVAGMFEIMYQADTLDTARDTFQMNLTLNSSNAAPTYDFDQIAIGNEGATPTLWYKDATGNQTADLGFTFAADSWYVALVYFNANYTVDAEFRDRETFSVLGSAHVSSLNLSSAGNVSLMNITNNHASGGSGNLYNVEYVYYNSDTSVYLGDSSSNTALGASTPDDKNSTTTWLKKKTSVDADTDWGNMSGGTNATTALHTVQYFGNRDSAPTSVDTFEKSNDSWYSPTDMMHICAMTPEKNSSYQQRQFAEWNWGDNFQHTITAQLLVQYGYDDDDLVMIDHRVNHMNLTVSWSDSFREQVIEDFREGLAGSNADIEACWWDPTTTASAGDWFSISGTWNQVKNGVGDGLENVYENSLSFFGASNQGSGEWVGSSGSSKVGTLKDGIWTGTAATIGNLIGVNGPLGIDIGEFTLSTSEQVTTAPFKLMTVMQGTYDIVIVLFVVGLIVLAAVLLVRWKKNKHAGGKDNKATFKGQQPTT